MILLHSRDHKQAALVLTVEGNQAGKPSALVQDLERTQQFPAAPATRDCVLSKVQPAIEVRVLAVSRMGRYSATIQGSCRLNVEFALLAQAQAVLRAAFLVIKAAEGFHSE